MCFLHRTTFLSLYNAFTPCIRDHEGGRGPHLSISVITGRMAMGIGFEETLKDIIDFLNKLLIEL